MNHSKDAAIIEVTETELATVVGGDAEGDRALMEFLERYRQHLERQQFESSGIPVF